MLKKTFLGVYSAAGKDAQGTSQKSLYFVWRRDKVYDVQRLDSAFSAVGALREIKEEAFNLLFTHEPKILAAPISDKPFAAPASPSPSPSPPSSPPLGLSLSGDAEIEATLRAHFRQAVQRLKRPNEKDAAYKALQTLLEVEEGIEARHKHIFAEFGISLRKLKEYESALGFCKRVLQMAPEDDHAYFNAARVLLEMGNWEDAERYVSTALGMAPGTDMYEKMLQHLRIERQKRKRPSSSTARRKRR